MKYGPTYEGADSKDSKNGEEFVHGQIERRFLWRVDITMPRRDEIDGTGK